MSGAFSRLLLVTLLLLLALGSRTRFTEAATPEEIQSLRAAAPELGVAPGTWNFSTDPCVSGWRGINCCSENSTLACCSLSQQAYPPAIPCDRSPEARVWMLIFRSDIFGQTLNGTLSESLCNLTSLRVLDLGRHRLSGQIPDCIASRLIKLESLRIGDNLFTGSIPENIGSLSGLKELFLDVTSVSGEIPASLGQLRNLTTLNLRSNNLEGQIPAELGQLRSLLTLELQVNRLRGGIPSSFSNLSLLTTLNLFNNELSGELSPSIFQSMSGLLMLDLRGNSFTGRVPGLTNLRLRNINFGFNQFSGSIPEIGSPTSLTNLFLGHNNLTGEIPSSFNSLSSLARLDLSHNLLVGSLESIGGLGLTSAIGPPQLDIAFNFFDVSTGPPSIRELRQPDSNAFFNCNSSSSSCSRTFPGRAMFFAVNSGGGSITSTSERGIEINFEGDRETAPFNQSVGFFYGAGPWALELSGDTAGSYRIQTPVNLSGAGSWDTPDLYSSMRWSSTHIAYHGHGLRSGLYTVTLHFAELVFLEPGYRMFDVILQGRLEVASLDIVSVAGPRSAYRITRNISVGDGSVSIELVHSRPDRFLPPDAWPVESCGPIISGVSVVSVDYRGEPGGSSLSSGQIAGISLASGALGVLVLVLVAYLFFRRRKNPTKPGGPIAYSSGVPSQPSSLEPSLAVGGAMTYQELHDATEGFSQKIGEGGFGAVYKGTLPTGALVAVKQLVKQNPQVQEDFKKEISIISKVRHRNLLAVIGYSLESEIPMLVCEFIPNGSLDRWLFRKREQQVLSWENRRKIAIGVSCGLAYLHDESTHKIIHCDVKPANILLDSDFNPRIADFGLARLYDEKESHVTATRLKGTAGYLAPEYAMHLQLSDKVDVYSFGVVLLELISGRRAVDFAAPSEQIVLVDWAHKEAQLPENMLDIVDKRLEGKYEEQEARDMATVAILCTQRSPSVRPKMQSVWLMLNGTLKVPEYLENLSAVIHSGASDGSSSSTANLGDLFSSQAFGSLRVHPGSNPTSSEI